MEDYRPVAEVCVFWVHTRCSFYRQVPLNVLREVCTYIAAESLVVCVNSKSVRFLNCATMSWENSVPLSQAINYTNYTVHCVVDATTVFVCGGWEFRTRKYGKLMRGAYLIRINNSQGLIQELPLMNCRRKAPGVFHDNGTVFVFGADAYYDAYMDGGDEEEKGRSGEMLDLRSATSWEHIRGQMRGGRWWFTPCSFRQKVYLCGYSLCIDIFDLNSRRFEEGPDFRLPEWGKDSVSWIARGRLTIITANYTTTYNLLNKGTESKAHESISLFPRSAPVRYGNYLFWQRDEIVVRATDAFELIKVK